MKCERAGAVAGGGGKVVMLSEGTWREAGLTGWRLCYLSTHSTLKYPISGAEHLMSRD